MLKKKKPNVYLKMLAEMSNHKKRTQPLDTILVFDHLSHNLEITQM